MSEGVTPTVSIIVPCYNVSNYVDCCLISVFSQSYPSLEVIAVNDGSTDNTLELLQAYSSKCKIVNQDNKGLSQARNAGALEATSQYLMFLDSDDILHENAVEYLMQCFRQNQSLDVVYGDAVAMNTDGVVKSTTPMGYRIASSNPSKDLCEGTLFQMGLAILKKQAFDRAGGFDPKLRRCEDLDFQFRLSDFAVIKKIPNVVLYYRINNSSLSRDYVEQFAVANSVLIKNAKRRNLLIKFPFQVLKGVAKMQFYLVAEHLTACKAGANKVSTFSLVARYPLTLPTLLSFPLLKWVKNLVRNQRLKSSGFADNLVDS